MCIFVYWYIHTYLLLGVILSLSLDTRRDEMGVQEGRKEGD